MNFLAYGFLSGKSAPMLVGNFMGDFVKGNQFDRYPPEIAEGIILHRKIDEFTDTHPVVSRSKNRIRDKYRHYAGVIIDIFYDHFLACNWQHYSNEPLEEFCQYMYGIIKDYNEILPEEARQMIPWMVNHNWLLNYATIEGIDRSLKGLSRRTTFDSGMENAADDLKDNYGDLELDFKEFFPDLIEYTGKA